VRLTQFTDYGLRVLMHLASCDEEHVSTEELAGIFDVSRDHLIKVVRRLCELGYIETRRGPSGGVRFISATRDVSVGEVVRKLEPIALAECFNERTNRCPLTRSCRLAPLLDRAGAAFLDVLDRGMIGDLVPRDVSARSPGRESESRAWSSPRSPAAGRRRGAARDR